MHKKIYLANLLFCCCWIPGCITPDSPPKPSRPPAIATEVQPSKSFEQLLAEINSRQQQFRSLYATTADKNKVIQKIKEYWVNTISNDLYEQWKGTPWDFNGTTKIPKQGTIACGYFVTTMLQDMGCKLDRVKLSTCTSMAMMKKLTPGQIIRNLSYLTYDDFNKRIWEAGKGVYVIGLDFHTGFIINDGSDTWFLHSNYINREGVIKQKISESVALKASGTRFVSSLTEDKDFLRSWVNNE